jgi:hypothetical protein
MSDTQPPAAEILTSAIRDLGAQLAALIQQRDGGGMTADQLEKIIEGQRKALRPSNEQHPELSAFSFPGGDLKARQQGIVKRFKREVWLNGHREDTEALTPTEVDMYNRLSESLPGPDSKRTARNGTWIVEVDRTNRKMHLTIPCKAVEQIMNLPGSLTLLLTEFLDGPEAVDPLHLLNSAALVKDLQQQIEELRQSIQHPAALLATLPPRKRGRPRKAVTA